MKQHMPRTHRVSRAPRLWSMTVRCLGPSPACSARIMFPATGRARTRRRADGPGMRRTFGGASAGDLCTPSAERRAS